MCVLPLFSVAALGVFGGWHGRCEQRPKSAAPQCQTSLIPYFVASC